MHYTIYTYTQYKVGHTWTEQEPGSIMKEREVEQSGESIDRENMTHTGT